MKIFSSIINIAKAIQSSFNFQSNASTNNLEESIEDKSYDVKNSIRQIDDDKDILQSTEYCLRKLEQDLSLFSDLHDENGATHFTNQHSERSSEKHNQNQESHLDVKFANSCFNSQESVEKISPASSIPLNDSDMEESDSSEMIVAISETNTMKRELNLLKKDLGAMESSKELCVLQNKVDDLQRFLIDTEKVRVKDEETRRSVKRRYPWQNYNLRCCPSNTHKTGKQRCQNNLEDDCKLDENELEEVLSISLKEISSLYERPLGHTQNPLLCEPVTQSESGIRNHE